jgi:FixJ family two-component response regulator
LLTTVSTRQQVYDGISPAVARQRTGVAKVFTVYLVDDDRRLLKALALLICARGYDAQPFSSSRDFLAQHDATVPGCAIFDFSMPNLDGLQLQEALAANGVNRPIIFLTGRGDIPVSVRAMKAGAIDFLTKPVRKNELFAAISRAEQVDTQFRLASTELAAVKSRIKSLTPRELEVLSHVVAGRLNKQIAGDLGTVEKTIKFHRGHIMKKLGVRTVADLVRLAEKAGIASANPEAALLKPV